ncbi:kinase-like domain-containing protein [Delphinella strobiligena]|nr:kinase-like domain-containing protein [Delphinella strobiligena]
MLLPILDLNVGLFTMSQSSAEASLPSIIGQLFDLPISLIRRLQWVSEIVAVLAAIHRLGLAHGSFSIEDVVLDERFSVHSLLSSSSAPGLEDQAGDVFYLGLLIHKILNGTSIALVAPLSTSLVLPKDVVSDHSLSGLASMTWGHTISRCVKRELPSANHVLDSLYTENFLPILSQVNMPSFEIPPSAMGQRGFVEFDLDVVIKSPLPRLDPDYRISLEREAFIYQYLPKHPVVVDFLGYDPLNYRLKLRNLSGGTFEDYLDKGRNQVALTPTKRIQWVLDALEGLKHMHSHHIIHGDLHTGNIMLDSHLNLKIIDFSESVFEKGTGHPAWLARNHHNFETSGIVTIEQDLANAGSSFSDILWEDAMHCELDFGMLAEYYWDQRLDEIPGLLCADVLGRAAGGQFYDSAAEFQKDIYEWAVAHGIQGLRAPA